MTTSELVATLAAERDAARAEAGRLRGIINEAQWSTSEEPNIGECPWCGGQRPRRAGDGGGHFDNCPAFNPDGTEKGRP